MLIRFSRSLHYTTRTEPNPNAALSMEFFRLTAQAHHHWQLDITVVVGDPSIFLGSRHFYGDAFTNRPKMWQKWHFRAQFVTHCFRLKYPLIGQRKRHGTSANA